MDKNKKTIIGIFTLIMSISCLSSKHMIYISAPPVKTNKKWFKHSRMLYDAIKDEVVSNGDTIELFPKKRYRESTECVPNGKDGKYYSAKELLTVYDNEEFLIEQLLMLILKRSKQSESKVHLIGHGRAGDIMLNLKYGAYSGFLDKCAVFDGDQERFEESEELNTIYDGDILDVAFSKNGNLVLNIDTGAALKGSSHKTEIIALVTATLGLIGGLIALF